MVFRISLMIALTIVVVSCSSDDPVSPQPTVEQPKAGSTFTYERYSTDPTTGAPIESSKIVFVTTIEQTGLTFLGKTNVSKVKTDIQGVVNESYLCYEPNGDISISALYNDVPAGWVTWPTATRTTIVSVVVDTTYSSGGLTISNKVSGTTSFVGNETMTVKGKAESVSKMLQVLENSVTMAGIPQTLTISQDGYYAPSIRFFAKSYAEGVTNPLTGQRTEGMMSILVDYDLK